MTENGGMRLHTRSTMAPTPAEPKVKSANPAGCALLWAVCSIAKQEWIEFNLHRADLHMSFAVPNGGV